MLPLVACSLVELDSRAERDSRCRPCPGLTLAIGATPTSTPPAPPSGITARPLLRGLPEAVFLGMWAACPPRAARSLPGPVCRCFTTRSSFSRLHCRWHDRPAPSSHWCRPAALSLDHLPGGFLLDRGAR